MRDNYRIAKLQLKTGDVVVVKVDGQITQTIVERVRDHFTSKLPEGVNVTIIDSDIELSVLSADEIAHRRRSAI